MLPISSIFGDTRKLRFSKPELVIGIMVLIIFGRSKSFQYRRINVLRYSIFLIYLTVFIVILADMAMIGTFRNIN